MTAAANKLAVLRARTGQTKDRLRTALGMWPLQLRAEMLYGISAIMTPGKVWFKQMNKAQAKAARWVLGTSMNSSGIRVCREVGWSSIEAEVARAQMCWLAKVMTLEGSRWPRMALGEMLLAPDKYKLLEEVGRIMGKYEVTVAVLELKGYNKAIARRVHKIDWEDTTSRIMAQHKCDHQLKERVGEGARLDYLGTFSSRLWTRRVRCQDWYNVTGLEAKPGVDTKKKKGVVKQVVKQCPLCRVTWICPGDHIIRCKGVDWGTSEDAAAVAELESRRGEGCQILWDAKGKVGSLVESRCRRWVLRRKEVEEERGSS